MRPNYDPFDYIRRAYSVPAKYGARVEYTGDKNPKQGTVTGVEGAHLIIRMDGETASFPYHPTWALRFLDGVDEAQSKAAGQ